MRCAVIALGNPIMGDDGVGLAALAQLEGEFVVAPAVDLVDGGTGGLALLPVIEDADQVLILDAIRRNMPPGSLIELAGDDVPRGLPLRLSPHEVNLQDVLALAQLRGRLPREVVALGVEPERVELIAALSPAVARALPVLVARAAHRLAAWGYATAPKAAGVGHA